MYLFSVIKKDVLNMRNIVVNKRDEIFVFWEFLL